MEISSEAEGFRQWISQRSDPDSLKAEAYHAIDSYNGVWRFCACEERCDKRCEW